jgi:plastocyanin
VTKIEFGQSALFEADRRKAVVPWMQKRKLLILTAILLAALALAGCSDRSSNFGKYYKGRTLHINVLTIETAPELRYATIDPEQVVRHWRLVPSDQDLELVMVNLKVENHTATSAIISVDQQAAQLRDFVRETYSPIDLSTRLYQDFRGQAAVDVRMDLGQCFDPNQMYITPGTTVNWVNEGEEAHYLKLDGGAGEQGQGNAGSTSINPGESYARTFGGPGTWKYRCSAEGQPDQEALVVVEEMDGKPETDERAMLFINGSFDLKMDMGIDGWVVFEAPKGTKFRDFRWRAGDSITVTF